MTINTHHYVLGSTANADKIVDLAWRNSKALVTLDEKGVLAFRKPSAFFRCKCLWNSMFGRLYEFKEPARLQQRTNAAVAYVTAALAASNGEYAVKLAKFNLCVSKNEDTTKKIENSEEKKQKATSRKEKLKIIREQINACNEYENYIFNDDGPIRSQHDNRILNHNLDKIRDNYSDIKFVSSGCNNRNKVLRGQDIIDLNINIRNAFKDPEDTAEKAIT